MMSGDREKFVHDHIAATLGPLLKSNGFELVAGDPLPLIFRSVSADLLIGWDGRGGQFSFFLRPSAAAATLHDVDLIRALLAKSGSACRNIEGHSPDNITIAVKSLRDLLQSHGTAILRGDLADLQPMRRPTEDEAAIYTQAVIDAPSIRAAESAWTRRDYHAVVRYYDSVGRPLSPVETARLTLAKKKSRSWLSRLFG